MHYAIRISYFAVVEKGKNCFLLHGYGKSSSMVADRSNLRLKAEKHFYQWLNKIGIKYFYINQQPNKESTLIKESGGKRPDFLLFYDGRQVLVDVKCLDYVSDGKDVWFCILKTEIKRLVETEKITSIPVWLAISAYETWCPRQPEWYFILARNLYDMRGSDTLCTPKYRSISIGDCLTVKTKTGIARIFT